MSKVLWIADGGSTTGFARVTHAITDRLVEKYGHEVHVLATNYKGDPFPSKASLYVPTLRNSNDTYGQSRFIELAAKIMPDVIVMLNDPQVIYRWLAQNKYDPEMLIAKTFPKIAYIPVDGTDMPKMYEVLAQLTNRVAMSKHGLTAMPEAQLVYHGVDTDLFWPIDSQHPITTSRGEVLRTKKDCKRYFGFDADSFLIGRIDRNTGRKDFPATWKALLPLMRKHADITAYFHCKARNTQSGINLPAMFSREMDLMHRFRVPGDNYDPHMGYSQQDLNALYNAFDLTVSTSRGEGFGLTLAESLACAVPVIAQNVSAIPEVVGPGGTLIEPDRPITVPFGQDQWLANIDAFTEAIEFAYQHRGWRREKGEAGRAHVTSMFQWDEAAAKFDGFISAITNAKEVVDDGQGQERPANGRRSGPRGSRSPRRAAASSGRR